MKKNYKIKKKIAFLGVLMIISYLTSFINTNSKNNWINKDNIRSQGPHGGEMHDGNEYLYVNISMTWLEAKVHSENQNNGHLVTITSIGENSFVNSLSGSNNVWLGFTDEFTEGIFQWINGETTSYINWAINEPNNAGGGEDYAYMRPSGYWNDQTNTASFAFVIEWDYIKPLSIPSLDILTTSIIILIVIAAFVTTGIIGSTKYASKNNDKLKNKLFRSEPFWVKNYIKKYGKEPYRPTRSPKNTDICIYQFKETVNEEEFYEMTTEERKRALKDMTEALNILTEEYDKN